MVLFDQIMLQTILLLQLLKLVYLSESSTNISNQCSTIPFETVLYFQCPPSTDLHCIRSMIKSKIGSQIVSCSLKPAKNPGLKLVNATDLISALQHTDPFGRPFCSIVMFYAPNCVFSRRVANYVYLLAKVFPQLQVYAVNLHEKSTLLDHLISQHGIAATPVIFLFENSIAKIRLYDESSSFRTLAETLLRRTDLKLPVGTNLDDLASYGTENDNLREESDQFISRFFNFEEFVNGIDRYFVLACIVLMLNLLYFLHFSSRIPQLWP